MRDVTRRSLLKGISLAAGGLIVDASNKKHGQPAPIPPRPKRDLRSALCGVHNFLTTPFRSNYDLDEQGLYRNVVHHAQNGHEDMTIVVGGGLGELFTLDVEEQKALAEAAVKGAEGRLPVVVGTGGGYRLALRMAENAEKAGADAILLFSPAYGNESAKGVYEYFRAVIESVAIGVVLYPRGKDEFWPEVLKRLAEFPNVVGFKDPTGGVALGKSLGTLVQDRLVWIAEGETHALEALPAGARAYTTAVAALVPNACRDFWKHGAAGEVAAMKRILKSRIDPIVKVRGVKVGYGASGIKVALEALGRAGGVVRPPGTQVSPEDRPVIAEISRRFAEGRQPAG